MSDTDDDRRVVFIALIAVGVLAVLLTIGALLA
jgi:hypothetical protein